MDIITINKNQLEKIISKKVEEQIEMKLTKKYLIELFEDIALTNAIKEGDNGKYINLKKFKNNLLHKINKK